MSSRHAGAIASTPQPTTPPTTTAAYWASTASTPRDITCLVCSVLSLLACLFVLVRVRRHAPTFYKHDAVNLCIVATFCFGVVSNVNQIVAACVRLLNPQAMQYVCDATAVITIASVIPSMICEAGFFATMLQELANGGANDIRCPRQYIIGATLVGLMSAVLSFSLLPVDSLWGTRYSGSGSTWCWLPPTDSLHHTSSMYSALQIVFGYTAFAVTAVVGVYCYTQVLRLLYYVHLLQRVVSQRRNTVRRNSVFGGVDRTGAGTSLNADGAAEDRQPGDDATAFVVPRAVKLRILYFVAFVATWTTGAVHRYAVRDEGAEADTVLSVVQAALQPLVSVANATIFLASENMLVLCCSGDVASEDHHLTLDGPHQSALLSSPGTDQSPEAESGAASMHSNDAVVRQPLVPASNAKDAGSSAVPFDRGGGGTVRNAILSMHADAARHRRLRQMQQEAHLLKRERAASVKCPHRNATDTSPLLPPNGDGGRRGSIVAIAAGSFALTSQCNDGSGAAAVAAAAAVCAAAVQKDTDPVFERLLTIRVPQLRKPSLSVMLSLLAGYCDTIGFLTMELFTAHVTGNFATIGMSVVHDSDGNALVVKTGALAVFIATVAAGMWIQRWATASVHVRPPPVSAATATPMAPSPQAASNSSTAVDAGEGALVVWTPPRVVLVLQVVLLLGSCLANSLAGPVRGGGDVSLLPPCLVGWLMVSAMALQNLFQRLWLTGLPMTTLMTGNTVGIVVDAFSWSVAAASRTRVKNASLAVTAFVSGCVLATTMELYLPELSFAVPPILSLGVLTMGWDGLSTTA